MLKFRAQVKDTSVRYVYNMYKVFIIIISILPHKNIMLENYFSYILVISQSRLFYFLIGEIKQ